MRSRTSSKSSTRSNELERPKLKEESHLSSAFIRSLVRHLSSSRPKTPMSSNSPEGKARDVSAENVAKFGEVLSEAQEHQQPSPPQPQPQPKKQVRRRFHTSRPYQEKLLNMAEARREIVAALKFHRAMKKAGEQQLSPLRKDAPSSPPPAPIEESHLDKKYRRNTRIYSPSSTTATFDYFSNPSFPSISHPSNFSHAYSTISPVAISENLNFALPSQPLGLNLNFQDFENLEITFSTSNYSSSSLFSPSPSPSSTTTITSSTAASSSSSSSSYSRSSTTMSVVEIPSMSIGPTGVSEATSEPAMESLHPIMDVKEMAEIRSIGDQYDMEWNDRMNSVHSARWCKFFKTVEATSDAREERIGGGEDGFGMLDEAMGIPPCLVDQQHLDDYGTDGGILQDAALACMDIGEIEGMDGEWLL